MDGRPNPRQELDGILDRQGVGSGYRGQLIGNLEDYVRDIALAGQAEELDQLYARVRDAEDARKAAVGLLEKQNLELVRLKAARARVRALHVEYNGFCNVCCDADTRPIVYPCATVQALDA